MSEQIKSLLEQLVESAKARGISQAQLAERAGISPVGLSKAKHRGDIRAATLQALAEQLDMSLALVPRQTRAQAVEAIRSGTFFGVAADDGGED